MQLISMMLWMVAILTILSGIAIFFGSYKVNRTRSAWFFVATIFALIWTAVIVCFLNATEVSEDIVWMVKGTYVSSIFIDVALLGYVSWRQKSGKIITLSFLVVGIILSVAFLVNPDLLYLNIIISKTGNSLVTNTGVFYYLYIAFFGFLVPTVLVNLLKQILL